MSKQIKIYIEESENFNKRNISNNQINIHNNWDTLHPNNIYVNVEKDLDYYLISKNNNVIISHTISPIVLLAIDVYSIINNIQLKVFINDKETETIEEGYNELVSSYLCLDIKRQELKSK